jgi:hypothetical protein
MLNNKPHSLLTILGSLARGYALPRSSQGGAEFAMGCLCRDLVGGEFHKTPSLCPGRLSVPGSLFFSHMQVDRALPELCSTIRVQGSKDDERSPDRPGAPRVPSMLPYG